MPLEFTIALLLAVLLATAVFIACQKCVSSAWAVVDWLCPIPRVSRRKIQVQLTDQVPDALAALVLQYLSREPARVVWISTSLPRELTRPRPQYQYDAGDRYGVNSDGIFYVSSHFTDCMSCDRRYTHRQDLEADIRVSHAQHAQHAQPVRVCKLDKYHYSVALSGAGAVAGAVASALLEPGPTQTFVWVLVVRQRLVLLSLALRPDTREVTCDVHGSGACAHRAVIELGSLEAVAKRRPTIVPVLTQDSLLLWNTKPGMHGLGVSLDDLLDGRPRVTGVSLRSHLVDWTDWRLDPVDLLQVETRVFISARARGGRPVVFELETSKGNFRERELFIPSEAGVQSGLPL
jgi:hypothetical protein